jgi:oligoribonuclease (3'-5' exoribonuclease)
MILWIDFESVSLSKTDPVILEAAARATDDKFETFPRGTFHAYLIPPAGWEDQMVDVVREMHTANRLIADVRDAIEGNAALDGLAELDDELAEFITDMAKIAVVEGPIPVAGSGVGHFDLAIIELHMPKTWALVTYWAYDVGVLRRWLRDINRWDPDFLEYEAPLVYQEHPHRAAADILNFIAEARHYRAMIGTRALPAP